MVAEGRRIPLNHPHSLVARAARSRQAAVANNVQAEPDFLPHPLLPDTVPVPFGDLPALQAALEELPARIPDLRAFRVGPDVGLAPGNADFAIVADVDDADGLDAALADEGHVRRPAADIDVLKLVPGLVELRVVHRRFADRPLDGEDVGDLRADVEVHELEPVGEPLGAQALDEAEDFWGREAELGEVAGGGLPLARALGLSRARPRPGPATPCSRCAVRAPSRPCRAPAR